MFLLPGIGRFTHSQLILRPLELGEPAAIFGVLAACRKRSRRQFLPEVGDYLIARFGFALWFLVLTYAPQFFAVRWLHSAWLYVCGYWLGYFVVMGYLFRVGRAVLRHLLSPLSGLLTLGETGYRWIVAAGILLTIPDAIGVPLTLSTHRVPIALFRFTGAIGLAQLLPIGFVTALGLRLGLTLRSRLFALLAGLCIEPSMTLITSWFHVAGVSGWTNLAQEGATYGALLLLTAYAFLPEEVATAFRWSDTLRMWDRIAHSALTRPLIVHRLESKPPEGAGPGPTQRAS